MKENIQEKSQIKQKILHYLMSKGITPYEFYKSSGVTRGILTQNNGINEDNLARFIAYATDVNPGWLLTGEGEMLKTNGSSSKKTSPVSPNHSNKITTNLEDIHTPTIETRPRIPFDAAAGSLSIALGSVSESDCERLPLIPILPRYDFTIIARGESMEPQYMSGDELACLFIKESSFIQWGRTHVLDTAQGIVVKRIYDHGTSITCKSNNPDYPDFDIPKEDIYRIALVVGYLRIE